MTHFSLLVTCNRHLYSLEYGRELDAHYAHDDAISCLSLSNDHTRLLSGSWDSVVKAWQCTKEKSKPGYQIQLMVSEGRGVLVCREKEGVLPDECWWGYS